MQQGYRSNLFESIGLGNLDIGVIILILFILVIILMVLSIFLLLKCKKQEKRLSVFFTGKDGSSLEEDIRAIHEENKYLKKCTDKNKKDIKLLFKKAEKSFSKIGLVKYDAFQQMGGQLSFSLAMLDENFDGFIMNSVHGTDGCYSYTKEVKSGVCSLTLSKEEEKALTLAVQYDNQNN